jgi:1,4-alpha-glucan branching enzyme
MQAPVSAGRGQAPGELAIVLHTHMPYVEGFGTWPFGEEWLWEAIATCYLPLLDVLGRAPITLSLTPVLCDQLEAPGAIDRCIAFLREIRPESHARDVAGYGRAAPEGRPPAGGAAELVAELRRSAAEYAAAADRLESIQRLPGGLMRALGLHSSWTSSATHAVLPLLATDAGVELQVQTGIDSHRRRFGEWGGGFWLPECAHAAWLHPLLEEAGVRSTCVELTDALGLGSERQLRPLATDDGPLLWPIDRAVISLVWSEGGYPADPAYRDYHALTEYHHRIWRNDGTPYDPPAASEVARRHAREFVGHVRERVAGGGVCVCALDTELLGHWWYEGVQWLSEVIGEANRQELPLTTLDDAASRHEPVPMPAALQTSVTSWGEGRDLRTWSGPAVADLAWAARTAELRVLAASSRSETHGAPDSPGAPDRARALRELLALQSSDWAFLVARGTAGDYPRARAAGHAQALAAALRGEQPVDDLRNLAPAL